MKIPTLKFTVKEECKALKEGSVSLDRLKSTSRFGVKIVKISIKEPGRTIRKEIFPDCKSELKPGLLALK